MQRLLPWPMSAVTSSQSRAIGLIFVEVLMLMLRRSWSVGVTVRLVSLLAAPAFGGQSFGMSLALRRSGLPWPPQQPCRVFRLLIISAVDPSV
jgi:hypothetical protein